MANGLRPFEISNSKLTKRGLGIENGTKTPKTSKMIAIHVRVYSTANRIASNKVLSIDLNNDKIGI